MAGARVAIAEEYRIGGTCVIRGCVPKKLLVYGAEFAQNFADARGYGWTVGNAAFDWATLRDNVQKEVTRLSGIYTTNLHKAGVTPFEERVEMLDAHRVKLVKSGSELSAERILIATGGRPNYSMACRDRSWASARTGLSCWRSFRSACSSWAAATWRSNSPTSSTVSARRRASCIAAIACCAVSTTTCARTCTSRANVPASGSP
jgi:hypothetical protein